MTLVDLGNSANSAYLSNLQKVDQSFTAKDLGRDVIDICIGNRWYIGLTHVEFSECFFVSQHSSNVNLTQITNGWINGLQQIIGTQRVGNMRPLGCNSLLDQIAIKFDHNSEFKRPHIAKKRMRWKSPSVWESCTLSWCKQDRSRENKRGLGTKNRVEHESFKLPLKLRYRSYGM